MSIKPFSLLATLSSTWFCDFELEYPSIYAIYGGNEWQMRKLRYRRHLALSAFVAVLALLIALPVAAPAAETGAETPTGPTEPLTPEASPPPSPGWVPQGSGTEGSSGGAGGVRQGSSLGSGGAATTPNSSADEDSSYSGSSGEGTYYPPESSAAPPSEESTSVPDEESVVEPVAPPPSPHRDPVHKPAVTAIGAATALTQPEVLRVAGVQAESVAKTVPLASQSGEGASGPNLLWWLAIGVCGILLVYAAGRLLLEPTEPFGNRTNR